MPIILLKEETEFTDEEEPRKHVEMLISTHKEHSVTVYRAVPLEKFELFVAVAPPTEIYKIVTVRA